MFASQILLQPLITSAILFFLLQCCPCMSSLSINASLAGGFSPAIATWYGPPTGAGSDEGACGYTRDVENPPYNRLIAAGNYFLYQSGQGCGRCYQVKCTDNPSCSGYPITITITDLCPDNQCTADAVHFDMSGQAFGYLAKQGQADALRKAGRINIQYQRVPCNTNTGIAFKLDPGCNQYYLAFVTDYVNGDGDLGYVEILPSNSKTWIPMKHSWGATYKVDLNHNVLKGPYSIRITTFESKKSVVAINVIPDNWSAGQYYTSKVNVA